jgi:O-antigen ligase
MGSTVLLHAIDVCIGMRKIVLSQNSFLTTPRSTLDAVAKTFLVCAIFFTPLGNAPAFVFMALTVLAWLAAGGYLQRLDSLRGSSFTWAALSLYVLLWIGVTYSSAPAEDIWLELRKYSKLLFMLLAITLLQDEKWRTRALNAFALAMFITLVLSMLSVVWPLALLEGSPGNHHVFKDHIAQNLMMSFFVLIMLVRSRLAPGLAAKMAYLGVAVIAAINILGFVIGRTGYVSLAAVIAVFILCYIPARQRWACLVLAVVAGLTVFQLSDTFRGRILQAAAEFKNRDSGEVTSVGARIDMLHKSIHLIKERPLVGWGTGSYPTEYCRLAASETACDVGGYHPHNQFFAFGVQLGMVGILAYLVFLGGAVWRSLSYAAPQQVLALGLLGVLLVDSLLHAPLFLVGEAQFFILMLAVVLAARPDRSAHLT